MSFQSPYCSHVNALTVGNRVVLVLRNFQVSGAR